MAHSIDREAVIRFVFGGAARDAQALFSPEHWAGNPASRPHPHDPVRARDLLAELGYTAEHPLRLVYKTCNDPFRVRLATLIQAQLRETGIAVEVQSHDWGTFYDDVKAGCFHLMSLSWVGVKTPDIFRYAFHGRSLQPDGVNRGRYRSQRVGDLLEQIAQTGELQEQVPHYQELQRVLLEDLPYVPLWYEHQRVATRREVSGYRLATDGNYDGLRWVERFQPTEHRHVVSH